MSLTSQSTTSSNTEIFNIKSADAAIHSASRGELLLHASLAFDSTLYSGAAGTYKTRLIVIDPTLDRIISLPDANGTLIVEDADAALGNISVQSCKFKSFGGAYGSTFTSAAGFVADNAVAIPDFAGTLAISGSLQEISFKKGTFGTGATDDLVVVGQGQFASILATVAAEFRGTVTVQATTGNQAMNLQGASLSTLTVSLGDKVAVNNESTAWDNMSGAVMTFSSGSTLTIDAGATVNGLLTSADIASLQTMQTSLNAVASGSLVTGTGSANSFSATLKAVVPNPSTVMYRDAAGSCKANDIYLGDYGSTAVSPTYAGHILITDEIATVVTTRVAIGFTADGDIVAGTRRYTTSGGVSGSGQPGVFWFTSGAGDLTPPVMGGISDCPRASALYGGSNFTTNSIAAPNAPPTTADKTLAFESGVDDEFALQQTGLGDIATGKSGYFANMSYLKNLMVGTPQMDTTNTRGRGCGQARVQDMVVWGSATPVTGFKPWNYNHYIPTPSTGNYSYCHDYGTPAGYTAAVGNAYKVGNKGNYVSVQCNFSGWITASGWVATQLLIYANAGAGYAWYKFGQQRDIYVNPTFSHIPMGGWHQRVIVSEEYITYFAMACNTTYAGYTVMPPSGAATIAGDYGDFWNISISEGAYYEVE